ncbi:glyoxalase [Micromonospora acroterricola]|uniref:Glyoxalase n=1 Tax=Micromonospora acroterricola TaxID=2202421 RepID=A0A317DCK8_9ACTN|nr:VOC family protein [Micromonospora acroterricola]PWR10503.1 glyoxalase [Micromonospora acroterricola]
MTYAPVIVSLPIADRATSHRFYRDALGLETVGELADDGIPEPLQFVVNDGLRLMLIPTGGFGWVIGRHEVAARGQSECVLSLGVALPADADAIVERARAAGAEVVTEPAAQPWGYTGVFADPDGHLWMVSAEPGS